jgi:hypothetical protein
MTALAHPSCDQAPLAPDGPSGGEFKLSGEDDLARAAGWLLRLLLFDRAEGHWVLLEPAADHLCLIVGDINETLWQPGQLAEAQRWAADLIEHEDTQTVREQGRADAVPLQVTEWRAVTVRGQDGWAPLFNTTRPCLPGVDGLAPDTGRACPCLSATRPAPVG